MSALLQQLAAEFDIPVSTLLGRRGIAYPEAQQLVVAEIGERNREHLLTPRAAQAWRHMQTAASGDGIPICIVSAFRNVERQTQIVRRKLASGIPIDEILAVSALPGYSEHHTGRAVDIGTPGCAPLEYGFKDTAAFAWLQSRAADFDFQMSYPADNAAGYLYEPWHWCHQRD